MSEKEIKISDYIDNEYKEYSLYTINSRAIPSLIDGFKPVQRKTIFAAQKECPSSFVKVSTLAGALPKIAAYHHGTAAGEDAITKMAQTFNNNLPLLDQDGTFGSSVVPEAAAARYIFVRLHKNFDYVYLDNEITPKSLDEDDHPEPIHYLPIIPMVLVNGASGIAVGFSTNILQRQPKDITNACLQYLKKGTVPEIMPQSNEYDVEWYKVDKNKFECHGKINIIDSTTLEIASLPPNNNQEKYTNFLISKVNSGYIKDYMDDSDKYFNFKLTFKRGDLSKKVNTIDKLKKDLKLISKYTENINVISENGNLREYDNIQALIKDFIEFRLKFYNKRIQYNIDKYTEKKSYLNDKIMFIEEVVNKQFDPFTSTKKQIIDHVTKKYKNSNPETLASIPVYNFTKDEILRFKKELKEVENTIKSWEKSDPKKLYIDDLENLLKILK